MKVYPASWFGNKDEVRRLQALLISRGHTITCNWTHEDATGLEGDALNAYLRLSAERDSKGVRDCDALILLFGADCRAALDETGQAHALGKKVIVVNGFQPGVKCDVFFYLPQIIHVSTMEEAVDVVDRLENHL